MMIRAFNPSRGRRHLKIAEFQDSQRNGGGALISLAVLAEFVSQHPWTPGTCIRMPMPYTDIHTHLHITTKLIRVGGQVETGFLCRALPVLEFVL